jgi:hypothetical protein
MFLGIDDASGEDLRTAGLGFFHSFRSNPGGPMVVTQDGDVVLIAYLEGPSAFGFAPRTNLAFQTNGLFVPTPHIEVDASTVFNPRQAPHEHLGDLIFEGSGVHLVVHQLGSMFDDETRRIPLWTARQAPSAQPVGFHSWRLVIGEGVDRRVIWERAANSGTGEPDRG